MMWLKDCYPSFLRSLKRRKKWISPYGRLTPRIQSASETIDIVNPICEKIGVTKVQDITNRDSLNIPIYSALLPGTDNKYWISGIGLSHQEARVSVMMEAIERYSSLARIVIDPKTDTITPKSSLPIDDSINAGSKLIHGTYSEVTKRYKDIKVLHPDEVVEKVRTDFNENSPMEFLLGYDLLSRRIEDEKILVPAPLVLYGYSPKAPFVNPFMFQHSNGLGSGNVIEEAICHALCELIERDAASIAKLGSSAIPYSILSRLQNWLTHMGYSLNLNSFADWTDDSTLFPDVDISEIAADFEPVGQLVRRFTDARIPLLIKNITQEDIGIPTFLASSAELINSDKGHFVYGYGTNPDARVALMRAITEVCQTRAHTIQIQMEKTKKTAVGQNIQMYKRRWPFMPCSRLSSNIVSFSEVKTYVNADILDDIKLILKQLKIAGLKNAIIVVLTNPDIGIPVVRAIVPGLETFDLSSAIMGKRAKQYFKKKVLS